MKIEYFTLTLLVFSRCVFCTETFFSNALIANHNFLAGYNPIETENSTIIRANDFKNHIISAFDSCKWDTLLIADVPNLHWEYYANFSDSFTKLQKYLYNSGTIDQIPLVGTNRTSDNKNLIKDLAWTLQHKCQVGEDKLLFIKGDNSLNDFQQYVDSGKRIIVLEYSDDFLETDDEYSLEERLSIIDAEIEQLAGMVPSPKTNLLLLGSSEDKPTCGGVFPKIFNKNAKNSQNHNKALLEKKERARDSRLPFLEYTPKFGNEKRDNGMMFGELKTELLILAEDNKEVLEICAAAVLGFVIVAYFFA